MTNSEQKPYTEGQLFKTQVGENWKNLSPNIQERFDADPSHNQPLGYEGTMTRVECSSIGWFFASLIRFTCALIPYRGENIPADIKVFTMPGQPDIFKRRTYYFPGKKPFTFKSNMRMDKHGNVIEFVGYGLGMKIRVMEKEGNLYFEDDGYFWEIGPLRIPLPTLITPGRTYLTHSDLGKEKFKIVINIVHPLFGKMFYQEGVFQHKKLGHE